MFPSVLEVFPTWSKQFEGRLPWMYLDEKDLVTTGVGDLIDPVSLAYSLGWTLNGVPVSDDVVASEWQKVKAATNLARDGGGAFAHVTQIRLSESAIDDLVRKRLLLNDAILERRFGNWNALCADAQLGVLSMSWAMGPEFRFPKFDELLLAGSFAIYENDEIVGGCAVECEMDAKGNPGLVPRNEMNARLFEAAQRVADDGLDPTVLHYLDAA